MCLLFILNYDSHNHQQVCFPLQLVVLKLFYITYDKLGITGKNVDDLNLDYLMKLMRSRPSGLNPKVTTYLLELFSLMI